MAYSISEKQKNLKMTEEEKDRKKLKITLIFSICFAVIIMATIILPNMMDLSGDTKPMQFEGNPVYFCDEVFEISSCHNKTALKAGMFSGGGHLYTERDFAIMEFASENMSLAETSGFNISKEIIDEIIEFTSGNITEPITVNATENLDIIDGLGSSGGLNMTLDPTLNMTKVPIPEESITRVPILKTETDPLTSGGMDLPPMPKNETAKVPVSNQTETIEEPISEEEDPEIIESPTSNVTVSTNNTTTT